MGRKEAFRGRKEEEMNMNSIVEWLAGRTESRNCIILTRDSALNQDSVILSKNTGEIIDLLVDTMRENPRLAFIIKEAYLTNKQYAARRRR